MVYQTSDFCYCSITIMSPLHETLKKNFGYTAFRPLQEEAISEFMLGRDVVVLMPTGGGKSLCFQIPALLLPGVTIVISPLISLMKDQVDSLTTNGVPATFINSSIDSFELKKRMDNALLGKYKLIYMAPERLSVPGIHAWLRQFSVSALAIDEAHCISQWGHDFRPDYRNLKSFRKEFPSVPIIALTATATPKVCTDIISQLHLKKPRVFQSSFYRANLHIRVIPKHDKIKKIINLLKKHRGESCIIYCFSRKDTKSIAELLQNEGFSADAYHAGLESDKRAEIQDDFIYDRTNIIVATNAFGMGIDKPDVRLVIHLTFPKTIEGYYQEIGRAGRDGLTSECVLLYSAGDRVKLDFFLRQVEDDSEREKQQLQIAEIMNYAEVRTCRWFSLISYFGEIPNITNCATCDACLSKHDTVDATEITQKILSGVLKTSEKFGKVHVIKVLRGSREQKVLDFNHDSLSVWGICKDTPEHILNEIFAQIVAYGLITKNDGNYPTFSVSQSGRKFLREKETIQLPKIDEEVFTGDEEEEIFITKKPKSKPSRKGVSEVLETDPECFAALKALRKSIADERGVPAFIIFGDKTLHALAYRKPQTLAEFSRINGVGEKKLKEFGEVFIKTLRQFDLVKYD